MSQRLSELFAHLRFELVRHTAAHHFTGESSVDCVKSISETTAKSNTCARAQIL
jgi:hypothetical protein